MAGNCSFFYTLESALVDEEELHYKSLYLSRGQWMACLGCSLSVNMGIGHNLKIFFGSHVKM